jgi:acid phosphatase type 7
VNAIQIIPSIFDSSVPPALTRGPYLQTTTPRSTIIRWRTNRPVEGRVKYGTNAAMLDTIVDAGDLTSEHILTLTNLDANTRYYYSIGTPDATLAGGADYYFVTHPTNAKPTRIWVIGDAGTRTTNQINVRDAYYAAAGGRHTDVWLMLGDNAYSNGTDNEFQGAVFNMYPTLLRQTAIWSVVGNHETALSHNPNIATVPYFNIHSFPVNGEAGGVPSGTERYYSFDYGDIHFVCLDSMTSLRTTNGPMAQWLVSDLEANTNKWIIALWHHPPYTKGSHDSDDPNGADFELVEMRQNIVPILEQYGVDLVLSGHSHCYERSVLLHGHYGYSASITPENILNGGKGDDIDGFYTKTEAGPTPYAGTVYSVVGSSGQATFGSLNHPAMKVSLLNLGSMIIDVNGDELHARFLRETGEIQDDFTIVKTPPAPSLVFRVNSISLANGTVTLRWETQAGRQYRIQRTTNLITPTWLDVGSSLTASGSELSWNGPAPGGATGFYRIVQSGE